MPSTTTRGGGHQGWLEFVHSTDLVDGVTANGNIIVQSGPSTIELSASTPLPKPSAGFDPGNAMGHLKFNINSITDFITQDLIKGSLSADGDVEIARGQANGTVRAIGNQVAGVEHEVGNSMFHHCRQNAAVHVVAGACIAIDYETEVGRRDRGRASVMARQRWI